MAGETLTPAPPRSAPFALAELREHATAAFSTLGFPSRKDEAFKYTDCRFFNEFGLHEAGAPALDITQEHLAPHLFANGSEAARLVFVNGAFARALSHTSGIPAEVTVRHIAAMSAYDTAGAPHIGTLTGLARRPFAAFNAAIAFDGAVVDLPPGVTLDAPIHLVFISSPRADGAATAPRIAIRAGAGAHATVVETHATIAPPGNAHRTLAAAVTEVWLDESATLDHTRLIHEGDAAHHASVFAANLATTANLTTNVFCLAGKWVRNDAHVKLDGNAANATLNGLYTPRGHTHVDNHTLVEHVRPATTSNQLYKGVLRDDSTAVFNGAVYVHSAAQKTNAFQSNRNMLLSQGATINTKPLADDVKCSHGATIGRLDGESLFYLRSRGIDEALANALLTQAFIGEVLMRVTNAPLRQHLHTLIFGNLPEESFAG